MWVLASRLILSLSLLSMSACESRTQVRLGGGNPPTFTLSGSGNLIQVFIYGPEPERIRNPSDKSNILWEIRAESMSGELVEQVAQVTYGVIPNGYQQVFPEQLEAPALIPGKHYK